MSLDQQLLGDKLRRYRKQFSRTLTDVSDATGISQQKLKSYEAGSAAPSGDEILILRLLVVQFSIKLLKNHVL